MRFSSWRGIQCIHSRLSFIFIHTVLDRIIGHLKNYWGWNWLYWACHSILYFNKNNITSLG